jgi:hypothetical protein
MANQIVEVYQLNNAAAPVATIILNGYNINAGGVFGRAGAMRSFKLVEGNLQISWERQEPLNVRDEEGNESKLRIFAIPAETGGTGFVEFL